MFEASFFLDIAAGFKAFAGGDISAQSEPGDMDPPAPSSPCSTSTFLGGEGILFDIGPFSLKTGRGALGALTTSLLRLAGCNSVCA